MGGEGLSQRPLELGGNKIVLVYHVNINYIIWVVGRQRRKFDGHSARN